MPWGTTFSLFSTDAWASTGAERLQLPESCAARGRWGLWERGSEDLGPELAAPPPEAVLLLFPLAASGGVGAHAGAGHSSAKRCWAGREVVAVAVSAGTTATAAAAGTAGAAVLSVRPSEKWETQGQR